MAKSKSSKSKSKDEDKKKSKSKVKASAKPTIKKKAKAKSKDVPEIKVLKKPMTATEIVSKLADSIQDVKGFPEDNERLAKAVVKQLMDKYSAMMIGSLLPKGVGNFKLFGGMLNVKAVKKPARKIPAIKKGTMVKNPFNGGKEEPHKGRPASTKPAFTAVRILPMKKLKDLVND